MCKFCQPGVTGTAECLGHTSLSFGPFGDGELYLQIASEFNHEKFNHLQAVVYLPGDAYEVLIPKINYCPMCGRKLAEDKHE